MNADYLVLETQLFISNMVVQ